jgi:hypothetical protein
MLSLKGNGENVQRCQEPVEALFTGPPYGEGCRKTVEIPCEILATRSLDLHDYCDLGFGTLDRDFVVNRPADGSLDCDPPRPGARRPDERRCLREVPAINGTE